MYLLQPSIQAASSQAESLIGIFITSKTGLEGGQRSQLLQLASISHTVSRSIVMQHSAEDVPWRTLIDSASAFILDANSCIFPAENFLSFNTFQMSSRIYASCLMTEEQRHGLVQTSQNLSPRMRQHLAVESPDRSSAGASVRAGAWRFVPET